MSSPKKSFFSQILNVLSAFLALFGIHEALFLTGIAALFYGLTGLWSVFGAFAVCGAILILVALFSVYSGQPGAK